MTLIERGEIKMKKALVLMAVLAIGCVMFAGCKSAETKKDSDLPAWVMSPPEGGLSAAGSAEMGGAGFGFAKNEAAANARNELASSLSIKVKRMFKNFVETTGVGDQQTVDKVTSDVSKQVAKVELTGSVIKKVEKIDNTVWVLVAVQPEVAAQVAGEMKKAAMTSFKNDKALWQKFQAKKGHEELEKEIEKEFGAM